MLKLLMSGHAVACITRLRAEGLHHGLLPLLDVILEQPAGERFVMLALSRTDERVRAGKRVSPGYLFATLLWHDVLVKWNARTAKGEHRIPALEKAIDETLDAQTEKLAIQRRFVSDMREIWGLQPRFERRQGKAPLRLLEHIRFRAGYDFLMLRAAADEVPTAFADWWTRFPHASDEEREQMLREAANEGEPAAGAQRAGAAGAARGGGSSGGSANRGRRRRETHRLHRPRREPGRTARVAECGARVAALDRADRTLVAVSPFYMTAPVDAPGPDYLNAVARRSRRRWNPTRCCCTCSTSN